MYPVQEEILVVAVEGYYVLYVHMYSTYRGHMYVRFVELCIVFMQCV